MISFAYTPEYYYNKRTMEQHLGIFKWGVVGGVMQGVAMDNPVLKNIKNPHLARAFSFGLQMTGHGVQYYETMKIKGYSPWEHEDLGKKTKSASFKSLMYTLTIR